MVLFLSYHVHYYFIKLQRYFELHAQFLVKIWMIAGNVRYNMRPQNAINSLGEEACCGVKGWSWIILQSVPCNGRFNRMLLHLEFQFLGRHIASCRPNMAPSIARSNRNWTFHLLRLSDVSYSCRIMFCILQVVPAMDWTLHVFRECQTVRPPLCFASHTMLRNNMNVTIPLRFQYKTLKVPFYIFLVRRNAEIILRIAEYYLTTWYYFVVRVSK